MLSNYLLSWTLRGGLIRLSSVRGPYSDCGDENPGIKQENIHNCSLLQLFCSACSHSRKRRTPSRRILKKKMERVSLAQSTLTCPGRRRRKGRVEKLSIDRQQNQASISASPWWNARTTLASWHCWCPTESFIGLSLKEEEENQHASRHLLEYSNASCHLNFSENPNPS